MKITVNGVDVEVEEKMTLIEALKFYGYDDIPTLCHHEGLTDYGACRLCVVEVRKGKNWKIVTSCTHPVKEGLEIRTRTNRIMKIRKMIIELLLAQCHTSKILQDLAAEYGVQKVRFPLADGDCILCGLCTRICDEQMAATAIGFVDRGADRKITTPFNIKSEQCKTCGACIYICPACQLRCDGPSPKTAVCGGCLNFTPTCLEYSDDALCFMDPCGSCVREPIKKDKGGTK